MPEMQEGNQTTLTQAFLPRQASDCFYFHNRKTCSWMASTASSCQAILLAQLLRASPATEEDAATRAALWDQAHSNSPAGARIRSPRSFQGTGPTASVFLPV